MKTIKGIRWRKKMTNWLVIILTSFIFPILMLPFYIRIIKKYKIGQNIRQEGPDLHQHKMGTPTMGGIIILITLAVVIFFFVPKHPVILYSLAITLGFGLIGLLDDAVKFLKKSGIAG